MLNIGNRKSIAKDVFNPYSNNRVFSLKKNMSVKSLNYKNMTGKNCEGINNRLKGSFFRKINEYLYTNNSEDAFNMYMKDNSLFENYHKGYEIQKSLWPLDPLNNIIEYILKNRQLRIIGDFGCGTARIGQTFNNKKGYKVYSFDLNCSKELKEKYKIIVCNMKRVPLKNNILDLAVFCLSLMGIDWPLFVKEAYRVLKNNGIMIITEVTSRIGDLNNFTTSIEQLNFKLIGKPINLTNYFTQFIFIKNESNNYGLKLDNVFKFQNGKCYFSRYKYHYGLRLHWMNCIKKYLDSERLRLIRLKIDRAEIDHSILKPCMYRKR